MNEVIVVHFLGVDDVTVLLLAQVGGVDAVGAQELPVGHAEGLANGLCDELRLSGEGQRFGGEGQRFGGGNYSAQKGLSTTARCEENHCCFNEHTAEDFFVNDNNNLNNF